MSEEKFDHFENHFSRMTAKEIKIDPALSRQPEAIHQGQFYLLRNRSDGRLYLSAICQVSPGQLRLINLHNEFNRWHDGPLKNGDPLGKLCEYLPAYDILPVNRVKIGVS